jgi:hypothetical protein
MSTSSHSAPRPRRRRTPLWLIEGADIVALRSTPLRAVAAAVCLVGVVLAVLVPDLVPPTPLVGAAVALAALLLGIAAAVAVDATDLTVRGPRHVRAAGGELVAILPSAPSAMDANPLAEAVLEARDDEEPRLLLGLAAAGRDARRCTMWTDALALAVARTGVSVLRVDLASGRSERAGLVEVVREGRKLPSVVTFDPELRLARVGAGRDHAGALEALPTLPTRLPRDLDVLLVALPTAASRQVVAATRALDHVLVVAERDTTSRVDLIAALDALEAAGIAAQVVLLDDHTAARLAAPPAGDVDTPADASTDEQADTEADEQADTEADEQADTEADEQAEAEAAADPDGGATLTAPADGSGGDASDPRGGGEGGPAVTAPSARSTTTDPSTTAAMPSTTPAAAAASAPPPTPEPVPATAPHGAATPEPTADPTPSQAGEDADRVPASSAVVEPGRRPRSRAGADAHPPIRLLPGAEAAVGASSPDLGRPSVPPREVDVMLGAAAASAAAEAEVAAQPLPPIATPRVPPPAVVDQPATPEAGHSAAPQARPSREPAPDTSTARVPEPVDVTDELPPVDGRAPRPGRRDSEGGERDDLRTTAKLAILLDDLQARDDRP